VGLKKPYSVFVGIFNLTFNYRKRGGPHPYSLLKKEREK
jgi:hypothetical protein